MYATQQEVLERVHQEATPLLASARQVLAARLETLGIQNGHAKVSAVEEHLQQQSRLNIHFDAQSGIEMGGSWVAVMQAWLHDTQYRSGHETGNFGGNKNENTRILWENELWRSAYAIGNDVDALQVPKYAGLNILPQPGGLDDPPGQFAFGDCYLQLKQHMLQRSTFCVGDSGSIVEAALALGVPCELQLATIDTILVAMQNDEFELDDETLRKLVAVLTTALPLPQFEYLIEAQVHSSIMLDKDIESLHLPTKYRFAPQTARHICQANLRAQRLSEKFGWRLCYY